MKRALALFSILVLAACSSAIEGNTQDITLLTPGAENAECLLHNRDFKISVASGETRKVQRSEEDLIVECLAPGNRAKTITVENDVTDAGQANVLTLGLGALYDYADNSLYAYPSVITVDFRDVPVKSYGLPAHHASDLPDPATAPISSYAPSTAKLESDKDKPVGILTKKERFTSSSVFGEEAQNSDFSTSPEISLPSDPGIPSPGLSEPGTTADELTRKMNPQVFGAQ